MAEQSDTQNVANRLYGIFTNVIELLTLFVRLFAELVIVTLNLFIPNLEKDVSGEVVLITGTGHGIGRELALQYVDLGCRVVCVDINGKGNDTTVADANSLDRGSAYGYICDVSNRESVLELANRIKIEVGPVSLLVNNVGIMPTHPIEQHTPEEIEKTFNINVMSHFWTIEAFLPHMKEKNRGHIVAISSIAGIVGLSNLVGYCASKFAVRGMMEALGEEIRQGPYSNLIKTTTVYPFMTNTGLCKNPRVKFPSILGLLDPKQVASEIIKVQRTDVVEATVPRGLLPFNNFCRNLPVTCAHLLKDYIDSGVESDLS